VITRIDFSALPMFPGESRSLTVWSDAGPLFVAIQCFREPPTPAHLTTCQECGSFRVNSGEAITVTASGMYEAVSGYMTASIRDEAGDKREIRMDIAQRGGTQTYAR